MRAVGGTLINSRLDLNQTQIMEMHLLLFATIIALGFLAVVISLIAWHFVRKTEATDTAIAERRLRLTRSAWELRSSRDASHPRPLTTKESRLDHPALTLSAARPS
jgi:hypothetical protein